MKGMAFQIIDDLLDLSKIEANRLTIEQVPCSVRDIIDEVARLMLVRANQKGLELSVTYRSQPPGRAEVDEIRFRQILVNLLANAIKFTEFGRVDLEISEIDSTHGQHLYRLTVSDTGIGMTYDQVRNAFNAFYQGDASTDRSASHVPVRGLSTIRQNSAYRTLAKTPL